MLKPGEIYWADFRDAGPHPVVIVSREELNRGRWAVAVMITSARFAVRSGWPQCIPLRSGQFGLTKDCVAQADTISAIPFDEIDVRTGALGVLDAETMRELIRAIGHVIASDREPQ
ncbi:MAG TPA: type II toxin-antitoxin system PemK/MazF family toxin [Phycisphaerae bacterium]|jgi:mRNA-degrading endonuclease toxin of MazEF toxin-antitoxin module